MKVSTPPERPRAFAPRLMDEMSAPSVVAKGTLYCFWSMSMGPQMPTGMGMNPITFSQFFMYAFS